MSRVLDRQTHKDCPFTEEELMAFYDMLFNVNTGNHCANPAPILWAGGSQMFEQIQREENCESIIDELKRLRKENEELKKQLNYERI